jgi:hypothetical protein
MKIQTTCLYVGAVVAEPHGWDDAEAWVLVPGAGEVVVVIGALVEADAFGCELELHPAATRAATARSSRARAPRDRTTG